jgi:hypothetical protein
LPLLQELKELPEAALAEPPEVPPQASPQPLAARADASALALPLLSSA